MKTRWWLYLQDSRKEVMLLKVLVVEDTLIAQGFYKLAFKGKVELIFASSIDEAEKQFEANRGNIAVIVMDGCVPGRVLNTEDLTRRFRSAFDGPIIASSSIPDFRRKLRVAGCDRECTDKLEIPEMICKILGIEL
ncbi:MAG: response regulator [Candidatus Staskawiczbacteria bacterium]|nr:response regulator [Candidatus Staskawiczbacteria bacterium]